MTASSRRSSSIGDPSGTPRTSMPRSAGAGAVRVTRRCDPGRRPSSRVSSTSGALRSRRTGDSLPSSGKQTTALLPARPRTGRVSMRNRQTAYRFQSAGAKTPGEPVSPDVSPSLAPSLALPLAPPLSLSLSIRAVPAGGLSVRLLLAQPGGEVRQHTGRDERRDVATERCDLLDEARGEEGVLRTGRHEDRLDSREVGVHLCHLQLVVEVAHGPQSLDDRVYVASLAEVRQQPVEPVDADVVEARAYL